MNEILMATLLWLITHLGISSTPLRGVLTARIGEQAYLGVYSIVALATFGYLLWVYSDVPRFDYIWLPNPDLYWLAKVTMPIACMLVVGSFMVTNPTMVGVPLGDPDQARSLTRGVTRITRHPFQWGVVIWAVGHIIANGDYVSVIFFVGFLILSGFGTVLMDRKKAANDADAWQAYTQVTSNFPLLAILSGRNKLVISELLLPAVVGLVLYALLYYFHEFITGAVIV